MAPRRFQERPTRRTAGLPGRVAITWDDAPCHIARMAQGHGAGLGVASAPSPGCSPDLNPIERLRDWIARGRHAQALPREPRGVERGPPAFVASINADAVGLADCPRPKFGFDPEHEAKLLG